MAEVNTKCDISAHHDVTQKLGSEQEDAALAERRQNCKQKRSSQIGFLLDVWPWRELRAGEPSTVQMTDREMRLIGRELFDLTDPSQQLTHDQAKEKFY